MSGRAKRKLSPFGEQLRFWRQQRGLSQLALAVLAETTPRYVSFIETGRSRPGRELVLRLAECMELPARDRNTLLASAGLSPVYEERALDDEALRPFQKAVEAILSKHEPYPGCAADALGRVLMANEAYAALWPDFGSQTPEEAVDGFFAADSPVRDMIENYAEVAWAFAEGQRRSAARANNPRLTALSERTLRHLRDVERPPRTAEVPVVCPRFQVGEQVIRTFSTVVRFEHAQDITLSELRVELVFPMDEVGEAFFKALAEARRKS